MEKLPTARKRSPIEVVNESVRLSGYVVAAVGMVLLVQEGDRIESINEASDLSRAGLLWFGSVLGIAAADKQKITKMRKRLNEEDL